MTLEISSISSSCLNETIGIARQLVALRDPYTANHDNKVGDFASAIAAEMGLDSDKQEVLMLAGYLHDIGKIVVPISILAKPGKLSPEEFNLIKNHVQAGFDLLKDISFPSEVSRAVLEHHERLNGGGYPNKLSASDIGLEGKILAVADVFLSMAEPRPYRSALGIESALSEIQGGRGLIYDEEVVDACVNLVCNKGYQLPISND